MHAVVLVLDGLLGGRVSPLLPAVFDVGLVVPLGEVDDLVLLPRNLQDAVGNVLFPGGLHAFPLFSRNHHDFSKAVHLELPGQSRFGLGVYLAVAQSRGVERHILFHQVIQTCIGVLVEVDDLHFRFQPPDEFLRLVGQTVELVAGEIPPLLVFLGQEVDHRQQAHHHHHHQGRVGAILGGAPPQAGLELLQVEENHGQRQ